MRKPTDFYLIEQEKIDAPESPFPIALMGLVLFLGLFHDTMTCARSCNLPVGFCQPLPQDFQ